MKFYIEADTFGTWRDDVEITKEDIVFLREKRASLLLESKGKKLKTTLREDVLEMAKEKAQKLAYQDSWSMSNTTSSGSEVIEVQDDKGNVLYEN